MCQVQALDLQIIVVFSVINGRVLLCLSTRVQGWWLGLLKGQIPSLSEKSLRIHLNN